MNSSSNAISFSAGLLLVGSVLTLGLFVQSPQAIAQSETKPVPSSTTIEPITTNFLVKVRKAGGFCVNAGCFSEVLITPEGKYQYTDSQGKKATGKIQRSQALRLKRLINSTNFSAIKSKPFQGTCPIAFDAPETIYTFRTIGAIEELPECKYEINRQSPLFKLTDTIYEQVVAEVFEAQP